MFTDVQRERFHNDGAILIKNALKDEWIKVLATGLNTCFNEPDGMSSELVMLDTQMRVDQFPAARSEALRNFIHSSGVADLVAKMIDAPVRFYMDQMFVKPSGEMMPTAWHQDTSYYNVEGSDLIRAWVSPDPVPRGASLEIVRGSHKWNIAYRPLVGRDSKISKKKHQEVLEKARRKGFYERAGKEFSYNNSLLDTSLPEIPDIENNRESFDIIGWDYEPCDVILFHGNLIHGACNEMVLTYPRRAHAIMFAGPDVRYLKRLGRVIPDPKALASFKPQTGQYLSDFGDIFPLVS